MTWPPVAAKLVVNVALPSAPTVAVPRVTAPSLKVTMPVGTPAPGATAATVAVNVTAWPTTAGFSDDARATDVDAGLTVTVTTAEVLAGKAPLRRTAFSAWVPTPPPDTSTVAWPLASRNAKLTGVLPS